MSALETWGDAVGASPLAVVAIHGRGQNVEFMRGLAERINVSGVGFFAPTAPGNTWYPHPFLDRSPENVSSLADALRTVAAAVAAAEAAGFARVVVLGFSQGACVLSHLILTKDLPLAGAVLFTGGYVGPDDIAPADVSARPGLPVLLRSLDEDPWVPPHRVADTAKLLVRSGAHVDALIETGDEHIVTERAIADARAFLTTVRDSVSSLSPQR
ncbi:phospholipase [Mycetocola sp. 2940]|uniref:alpha/beta hydrolase n=1 Tax=Mycetocola sp. 2940 TaxID=3156452 RepID=UPI0033934DDD